MDVLSLLERITPRQVDDLITEAKLIAQDYKFYYTLDNYEIHKYCFPGDLYGQGFELKEGDKINIDLETDIATAYDDFFTHISAENPVFFLDEYAAELNDLRLKIKEFKDAARPLPNYADKFNDYLIEITKNKQRVVKDATLFIAISTGILKDGLKRYNSIVGQPAFVTREERFENIADDSDVLKNVFLESYKINLEVVDRIFDAFVQNRKIKRRYSKRIDSEAIARVLNLNERLLQKHGKSKILLLFLSSTQGSTFVFDTPGVQDLLLKVNGTLFNFHRTVDQLFLGKLLSDLSSEQKIERLLRVKDFIEADNQVNELDNKEVIISADYNVLKQDLEEQFRKMRENYVNINLIRREQFEKIAGLYDALDNVATTMQMGAVRKLYSHLKEIAGKYEDEHSNLKELDVLETSFHIGQIFFSSFKKTILSLARGKDMRITRGKDKIAGRGQHLPIVFRYGTVAPNNQFDRIAELFLDQFEFLLKDAPKEEVIANLTNLATNIEGDLGLSGLANRLAICLYALVLPDANPEMTNSVMVEEVLLKMNNHSIESDPLLYSDYLCILAWIQRRNEHYDLALNTTANALYKFPDDARFYHSRFLINACTEDNLKRKDRVHSYKSQINDIRKAQELYDKILEGKPEPIKRNIDATLLNSELYMHLLLIDEDELDEHRIKSKLEDLRKNYLVPLKDLCKESYKEYPEFAHTEALLEKMECEYEADPKKRSYRLQCAIKTISYAIQVENSLNSIDISEYEKLLAQLMTAHSEAEEKNN